MESPKKAQALLGTHILKATDEEVDIYERHQFHRINSSLPGLGKIKVYGVSYVLLYLTSTGSWYVPLPVPAQERDQIVISTHILLLLDIYQHVFIRHTVDPKA